MNYISRKYISRRTVLKGAGAALALPFLDAMQPALTADREGAAAAVRRLLIVEYPLGVVDDTWNPTGEGSNYKISESLKPLEPYRNKFTVIRGFTSAPDRKKPDFHDNAVSSFLTGCENTPLKVQVGISIDQIAAKVLGATTPIASLELGIEPQLYFDTPCYSDANTNLPQERNPRLLFERLFGDSDKLDPAAQAARNADDTSIMDAVRGRIKTLNRELGIPDRRKLEQYFESIRDLERRISIASSGPVLNLPNVSRPVGVPESWPEHVKLMLDLQVLALQTDLTRVITLATASEASVLQFSHLGIPMSFHELSHHNFEKQKLDYLTKINTSHSEMFAYYLSKLDAIQEPGGSLLDHSMVLYGSAFSNPSAHSRRDLPIIVAGGGAKHGRFMRVSGNGDGPPLSNLHLELLQRVGVSLEKLGDSTGAMNCLGA